jgi:hypothetical protein
MQKGADDLEDLWLNWKSWKVCSLSVLELITGIIATVTARGSRHRSQAFSASCFTRRSFTSRVSHTIVSSSELWAFCFSSTREAAASKSRRNFASDISFAAASVAGIVRVDTFAAEVVASTPNGSRKHALSVIDGKPVARREIIVCAQQSQIVTVWRDRGLLRKGQPDLKVIFRVRIFLAPDSRDSDYAWR